MAGKLEQHRDHEVREAWEALRYWEDRYDRLSPLQRRARREALEHSQRWKIRLKEAEREAYGPPVWEPLAVALRVHRVPERLARARRRAKRAALVATASLGVVAGGSVAVAVIVVEKVLG